MQQFSSYGWDGYFSSMGFEFPSESRRTTSHQRRSYAVFAFSMLYLLHSLGDRKNDTTNSRAGHCAQPGARLISRAHGCGIQKLVAAGCIPNRSPIWKLTGACRSRHSEAVRLFQEKLPTVSKSMGAKSASSTCGYARSVKPRPILSSAEDRPEDRLNKGGSAWK